MRDFTFMAFTLFVWAGLLFNSGNISQVEKMLSFAPGMILHTGPRGFANLLLPRPRRGKLPGPRGIRDPEFYIHFPE